MSFTEWILTFIEEKEIDDEEILEVEGPGGTNMIPIGCLVDAMIAAPAHEQAAIKAMVVKIDFMNGDVVRYFRHLAAAIAV